MLVRLPCTVRVTQLKWTGISVQFISVALHTPLD